MSIFLILMGVSGSGKTTLGELLAEQTNWPFFDADHFHPPANVEKMRQGIPLTDEDRWPWLESLRELIEKHLSQERSGILACSALKYTYRQILRQGGAGVQFVFLQGDFELIRRRMQVREGHYMPASLLRSQFEALEPPQDAWVLAIDRPATELLAKLGELLDNAGHL
jgi:gluconokinase